MVKFHHSTVIGYWIEGVGVGGVGKAYSILFNQYVMKPIGIGFSFFIAFVFVIVIEPQEC